MQFRVGPQQRVHRRDRLEGEDPRVRALLRHEQCEEPDVGPDVEHAIARLDAYPVLRVGLPLEDLLIAELSLALVEMDVV